MSEHKILIVGGGFSGVAVACQLALGLPPGSQVTLVDSSGAEPGRGLAYATQSPLHLLNVPAGRMSWRHDQEDDFIDWLQAIEPEARAGDFAPRQRYGEYMGTRLAQQMQSRPDIHWQVLTGRVINLARSAGGRWQADLLGGETVLADDAVLTTGNLTPSTPHPSLLHLNADQYAADPWDASCLDGLSADAPLALVGTGLTMLDVLLSLQGAGHAGPIVAISRHGLLPQAHRAGESPPPDWTPPPDWLHEAGLRHAFHDVLEAAKHLTRSKGDWRDVMIALRPRTPQLWQFLGNAGRSRFLRHLRALWDSHRHRAAPASFAALKQAQAQGRIQVVAGRLQRADSAGDGVLLTWKTRGKAEVQHFKAARVINCTGPSTNLGEGRSELLDSLLSRGMLAPCPLGLGLLVDNDYRLLGDRGLVQQGLYYVGPMLRAQYWEATAVPELRQHAAHLVERLLALRRDR